MEVGRDPPPVFYERPEILPWHQFYWDAFFELSSERQIGMGLGPIPRSSMVEYAREFDLDRDETTRFIAIIRAVDAEYLHMTSAKSPKFGSKAEPIVDEVSSTDTQGVREVMDRVRLRAAINKKGK